MPQEAEHWGAWSKMNPSSTLNIISGVREKWSSKSEEYFSILYQKIKID
jgi:hypothetical protein